METYDTPQKLLPEYLAMYKPWEERVKLVEDLDKVHNGLKAVLQLQHGSRDPRHRPVHAILNGLPPTWLAEVVAVVSDELGLIRVHMAGDRELLPGVRSLFVMFHLEDVFDAAGLPAIHSADLSMAGMKGKQVQIVARSLCTANDREALAELQRRQKVELPLLQAVVVCLKTGPTGPLPYRSFPRPTVLAAAPEDLGTGPAAFFLAPTLQHRLDYKARLYVTKLSIDTLRIFKETSKPIDNEDEALDKLDTIKEQVAVVDMNNTRRLVYGELPKDMVPLSQLVGPQGVAQVAQLGHHAARPVLLHCRGIAAQVGLVELVIPHPQRGTVKTYGIFLLPYYRFFFPPDCFGHDLANIMPLPVKEQFAVCATLAWPDSKIPYVVTHIWNENLRRELGRPPPTGPVNDRDALAGCAEAAGEILGTRARPKTVEVKAASLVPVPANVITACKDIKTFDSSKVHMENGEVVRCFNNIVGEVESVISDHHAIVKMRPVKSKTEYRVLCHSDDVFHLDFPEKKNDNPHKFVAAWDLWKETAKVKKTSLVGLMRPGAKVRLNAVLVVAAAPNPGELAYCSSGVLVGRNSLPHTVPVACLGLPMADFLPAFKVHFQKVARSLDRYGSFLPSQYQGGLQASTEDQPKVPKAWKRGPVGSGMTLRPEYQLTKPVAGTSKATPERKKPEAEKKKPSVEKKPEADKKKAEPAKLPNPVKSKSTTKTALIQNAHGRIIKIINENYGIAVGVDPNGGTFQMLFDSFDLFLGNTSCKEMNKKLSDLIKVGDFIKYNSVLVQREAAAGHGRDISHLATAVVFASTHSLMRTRDIPNTAPKVTQLAQLEQAKVANFRTVTGLVGKVALTEKERKLVAEVEAGGKGGSQEQVEIDSDDEVEVLPTNADKPKVSEVEMKAANANLEARIKEFNVKDLRKVLMTYMTLLASTAESVERKVDLASVSRGIVKDQAAVQRLLVALGRKVSLDPKGLKVGQVFLSQAQVKSILEKGVLAPEHIKAVEKAKPVVAEKIAPAATATAVKAEPEGPLSKISADKLRKLLRSYMELLKQGTTVADIAATQELPEDKVKELLVEITKRCKDAPMVDGRRSGFKLHSFFVNSTWVAKICTSGLME